VILLRDYRVKLNYVSTGLGECIFRCGGPAPTATLPVEMAVALDGRFLGSSDDAEGSRRQSGVAHPECYDAFCRVAYGLPFLNGTPKA
jgi:hypothetical protein